MKRVKGIYLKNKEIVNYLIVGVLTTIVSILSYNLFRIFIDDYMICTVLSWIISVIFAYITNRKYVFASKEKKIVKEASSFTISRLFSLGAEMLVMWCLVDALKIDDRLAKVIVQFIVIILNYILSKLLVFKKK